MPLINLLREIRMTFTDHAEFFQLSTRYSGPCPMQLVVVIAVRKAVRAATMTFTATSIKLFFFIILMVSV